MVLAQIPFGSLRGPKLSKTRATYLMPANLSAQPSIDLATPPQPCSKTTAGKGPSPRGFVNFPANVTKSPDGVFVVPLNETSLPLNAEALISFFISLCFEAHAVRAKNKEDGQYPGFLADHLSPLFRSRNEKYRHATKFIGVFWNTVARIDSFAKGWSHIAEPGNHRKNREQRRAN
jgi:hypothetical protein